MTTAEAVMSAFARSTASDPSWWPGVVGYLSAQARLDYVGVDPSQVPFTAVTGAGEPLPSPDGDGAEALVRVPTDAGDYVVRLQSAADGSVEVVALTPPAHPLIGTAAAIAAPQENGAGVP